MAFSEFPENKSFTDEMKVINADFSVRDISAFINVEYAKKSGMPLHVNILTPAPLADGSSEGKYPLIIYVQGSAWLKQEMYSMSQLARMAQKGYVIAIVGRLIYCCSFSLQITDTKRKRYPFYDENE